MAEVAMADAVSGEDTVMVATQNAFLADEAVKGTRRRVVLANGAELPSGLQHRGQHLTPTGDVGGHRLPQTAHHLQSSVWFLFQSVCPSVAPSH